MIFVFVWFTSFSMIISRCIHVAANGIISFFLWLSNKVMASGPITSWQKNGETVAGFIFLGSKITADGDFSHEIKRCLLLGRKVMTNLDSIFRNRDITLSTKVRLVKPMVFPMFMYGCESWTIKKAEHRRIDAFELWCWGRLLRVPWTARRSNQSILREISPGCSLEGLMLKLKLLYFGHLMQRADSLEKTLILGKIDGRRRRGWQGTRWLDDITDSMDMGLGALWELVMGREALRVAVHGVAKRQTWLSDWTKYSIVYMYHIFFIYLSVDEHLSWFHFLAIVNSAAKNIGVHVSFQIRVFSWYISENGISGLYANSISRCFFFVFFLRNFHTVFHSGYTNLHSSNAVGDRELYSISCNNL